MIRCKICDSIVVPYRDIDTLQKVVGPRCRRCMIDLANEALGEHETP